MFIRSPFNYDVEAVSRETGLSCADDPGVAKQSFKDECDINVIVKRFGLTGQLPLNARMPLSGDFTGVTDFRSALDAVIAAQDAFLQYPAEVRKRFANDPQEMIRFLSDAGNREEAIKLGLVDRPPEKTRDVVQAVDELAAKIVVAK